MLKQIQHLPNRTSNAATLLLLGRIPIEGELHKRMLKTFGNIIRNENSVEKDIVHRQLAMKSINSGSWFPKVSEIADKYELPSPHDIIENPPSKSQWNKTVNTVINDFYLKQLTNEAANKTSLKYLNFSSTKIGSVHNIWKSAGSESFAINMACLKMKIVTGTLILQNEKSKFSGGKLARYAKCV